MSDYKIGYMKPPSKYKFKPGVSGNPKGRPKGSLNFHTIFNKILNEPVEVDYNGKTIKITKKHAIGLQCINQAVQGDIKAIKTTLPIISQVDAINEKKEITNQQLNTNDTEIVNYFLQTNSKRH